MVPSTTKVWGDHPREYGENVKVEIDNELWAGIIPANTGRMSR